MKSLIGMLLIALGFSVHGQIFVGSSADSNIGEYSTSGSTVNASLITGVGNPWGMAWDGNANLFVAAEGNRRVGEYTISGATVNASLISIRGDPTGVALDGSGHVFVIDSLFNT